MYLLLLLVALVAPLTAQISQSTFQRHSIAVDFPNGASWGYGLPTLADYDGDGDLDFSVSNLTRGLYWFEYRGPDDWVRRKVGDVVLRQLGATSFDVDGDSRPDLVIGGYWYRNPGNPREAEFERIEYDPDIADIHDIAVSDINGDGRDDLIVLGDRSGCFWYEIPEDPLQNQVWKRTTVTMDVLEKRDWIHSGIFPKGVGDLDGDGDMDLVVTDRWYENNGDGSEWTMHRLMFGSRGPYGLSARSWIVDLDEDGDADIVTTHGDQQNSGVAWLENTGEKPPKFATHYLANLAPGTRGSFHSLAVADFDLDGDLDIMTAEQEDQTIPPVGAGPRFFVFENLGNLQFIERVIYDGRLGGHDILVGDVDGDGDPDIASKVWVRWEDNANGGRFHADYFENQTRRKTP